MATNDAPACTCDRRLLVDGWHLLGCPQLPPTFNATIQTTASYVPPATPNPRDAEIAAWRAWFGRVVAERMTDEQAREHIARRLWDAGARDAEIERLRGLASPSDGTIAKLRAIADAARALVGWWNSLGREYGYAPENNVRRTVRALDEKAG